MQQIEAVIKKELQNNEIKIDGTKVASLIAPSINKSLKNTEV